MRKQIPAINDAIQNADDAASASAIALRDSAGDLFAVRHRASGGIRNDGDWHRAVVNKTSAYTIVDGIDVITGDTTSAGFTITLPAAASSSGKVITVVKTIAANTLTIQGSGAETINGSNTLAMTTQYTVRTLVCNGTAWYVIGS